MGKCGIFLVFRLCYIPFGHNKFNFPKLAMDRGDVSFSLVKEKRELNIFNLSLTVSQALHKQFKTFRYSNY